MLWQDLPGERDDAVCEDIVDLAFRLSGGTLAVEHAHALCRALLAELPWLAGEPHCGVHQIHAAASGNGWMRPERDACEVLNLSRRTRLTLRLPRQRLADAEELSGRSLDVGGHRLQLGKASERPLIPASTLYARYVICDDARHEDEERFINWVAEVLQGMGITPTRVLCGMTSHIEVPGERLGSRSRRCSTSCIPAVGQARSLMVAALPPDASLELQRRGLGDGRLLGCGLFVPHKGIEAVRDSNEELS
jgi:CRISPR-associated protein Cas6